MKQAPPWIPFVLKRGVYIEIWNAPVPGLFSGAIKCAPWQSGYGQLAGSDKRVQFFSYLILGRTQHTRDILRGTGPPPHRLDDTVDEVLVDVGRWDGILIIYNQFRATQRFPYICK